MAKRLSSGNEVIDSLLEGGLETDVITAVYGPAGSGKTNLCMLFCIGTIKKGKKVIYLDSENNFSADRFKQISSDAEELITKILFIRPSSFKEQNNVFISLKKSADDSVGLIIVDTISMLYRLEFGKENVQDLNRDLGRQLSVLADIARKKKIPVLVANQVYADMEINGNVRLVGGELVKYASKCIIEIKKAGRGNRVAIIKKHRSIAEGKETGFKITGKGFEER